jgi:hypothetical protein
MMQLVGGHQDKQAPPSVELGMMQGGCIGLGPNQCLWNMHRNRKQGEVYFWLAYFTFRYHIYLADHP